MPRNLPEAQRRSDILEAAKSCFVEKGFAATRMDDIAAAAGLSKGGLYFHFRSKSELMVEVVRQENVQVEEFLDQAERWNEPLPVMLDRLLAAAALYLRAHLDAARISQCILDEALRNDAIAEVVRDGEALFLGHLERLLRKAVMRGEVSHTLDPAASARVCMVIIEGAKTKFLHFPDWPWEAVLAALRRTVVRGLLGLEDGP